MSAKNDIFVNPDGTFFLATSRGIALHVRYTWKSYTTAFGAHEQKGAIPLITRYSLGDARDPDTILRILVAEDNPVNQRLITRLLEKRGHRVTMAADGREAVGAIERDFYDLVFMDVQMPELDGLEATAAIRKREAGTDVHVPIVALTAHAMKDDRNRCLAAGMDGYLSKPIRPQELDDLLQSYMDRHAQGLKTLDTASVSAGDEKLPSESDVAGFPHSCLPGTKQATDTIQQGKTN